MPESPRAVVRLSLLGYGASLALKCEMEEKEKEKGKNTASGLVLTEGAIE